MTSVSKNVCINKLADIINKYSNACSTIKMKPVDVNDNIYFNHSVDSNDEDPKFKTGDHVRISKHANISAKAYTLNRSEEVFVIKKKLKILYHGHMLLVILLVKKSLERFTKKNCKRQIKQNLG